jgi:hypothetical protein
MKKSIAVALVSLNFAWFGPCAQAQESTVPIAPEIIAKLAAKYAGLSSFAATGRVIADIDTSGGANPAAEPNSRTTAWDLGKPGSVTLFSLRLGKPDLYRIEWSQAITATHTNKGAAWSSGNGDFLSLAGTKRSIQGGMDMTLVAATGVSGGAASTLPLLFFHRTNQLQRLGNLAMLPDEKIGDEVCYVVSGDLNGQKFIYWITKDYWLKQKKMVLGGDLKVPEMTDVSDEDLKKSLSMMGQDATPEAVARMRDTMKSMQPMLSKIKGSITEKYETIQANPPVTKQSFDYEQDSTTKAGN